MVRCDQLVWVIQPDSHQDALTVARAASRPGADVRQTWVQRGWNRSTPRLGVYGRASHDSSDAYSNELEHSILQFDWRVQPYRLEISRKPDGQYWALGSGGYGTVRTHTLTEIHYWQLPC